jgi:hypothetical protein
MHALSIGAPLASRWVGSRIVVLMRVWLQLARVCSPFFFYHLQIPARHARAGVGPGIASHKSLCPAGGRHHDPCDDPSFMQRLLAWSAMSIVSAISLTWDAHRPQEACLLPPDTGGTLSTFTLPAPPLSDVHTINGLQQTLKMLGYRIAVDGAYGAETRQVVEGFQMRTGVPAHSGKRNYSAS